MSSAVVRAVQKLNHTVTRLEESARKQEQNVVRLKATGTAPQNDLFTRPSAANANASGARPSRSVDLDVLARKLDVAIEEVERLLQEA